MLETALGLTAEGLDGIWLVLLELAPWLLLGLTVAGAMHAWLPEGFMQQHLSGRTGVAKAVAIGVPLPLCSCSVIPVGIGLKEQVGRSGPAVGFLISTPQTGVDSLFVTASLLGWPFALFKVATALVTGLVGGTLQEYCEPAARRLPADLPSEMPRSFQPLEVLNAPAEPVATTDRSLLGTLSHVDQMLRSIYFWLMIGVVISVVLKLALPEGALAQLADYGLIASMVVALLVSLPLYVCAVESVPIAAALAVAGLPLGGVMVFLMAGPATNVATIGALWRGIGPRPTMIYLATIIVGSILGGLLFEAWGFANVGQAASLGHTCAADAPWWATASALLLLAWMTRLAWLDLRGKD